MKDQQPEAIAGASLDIAAANRDKLKQLFPNVFMETKDAQGKLVETVDFEKLKAEIGHFSALFEHRRERYGMDWPGKKDALRLIQTSSRATLKPYAAESVDFDTTENLFLEGDNLEVLKLLQKSYYGKVKMIYIDPPYNTGKEFIYPDNFTENLQTYLEYAGLIDGEGKRFSTNTANEGRFHTKWLNMMYPRLYLARNLLRDDGIIFISIDDNEVANLRKLCDEIFGEENFVGTFLWRRRQRADSRNQSNVSTDHEYVLAFSKNGDPKFLGDKINVDKYKNPDNDPRGPWASIDLSGLANATQRPNLHFEIIDPDTGNVFPPNPSRGWSKSRENIANMIREGRIIFPKNENGRPREKKFLKNILSAVTGFTTCLDSKTVGYTTNGTRELTNLLEGKYFDFPKPSSLVKVFIEQATGTSDIILDFFAGSATTAHAVLDLNKQDGGNRKFILVQLPEPCAPDSEAFKAGFKTIADIGKERIRRVIKKFNEGQAGELPLDETAQDRGFRVLKLDQSNFKQWRELAPDTAPEVIEQALFDHVNHVDAHASQKDLLFEILIKSGFPLSERFEQLTLANKTVYALAEGALLVCLEDEVSKDLMDAVVETNPQQFICLDAAFDGNDQLKANAVQTFAAHNLQKEKHNQIVFRTV